MAVERFHDNEKIIRCQLPLVIIPCLSLLLFSISTLCLLSTGSRPEYPRIELNFHPVTPRQSEFVPTRTCGPSVPLVHLPLPVCCEASAAAAVHPWGRPSSFKTESMRGIVVEIPDSRVSMADMTIIPRTAIIYNKWSTPRGEGTK